MHFLSSGLKAGFDKKPLSLLAPDLLMVRRRISTTHAHDVNALATNQPVLHKIICDIPHLLV